MTYNTTKEIFMVLDSLANENFSYNRLYQCYYAECQRSMESFRKSFYPTVRALELVVLVDGDFSINKTKYESFKKKFGLKYSEYKEELGRGKN